MKTFYLLFIGFALGLFITSLLVDPIKNKSVCNKEESWVELKQTDDRLLNLTADGFEIIGKEAFAAQASDLVSVNLYSSMFKLKSDEINNALGQRHVILKKLGY